MQQLLVLLVLAFLTTSSIAQTPRPPRFTRVSIYGEVVQISAGKEVWGINKHSIPFVKPYEIWQRVDGKLRHVSVGDGGHVWGVNSYNQIYYRQGVTETKPQGTHWQLIPGGLYHLSVGADGRVWGANAHGQVWYRAGYSAGWQSVDGNFKEVEVGPDGTAYGIKDDGEMYYRTGVTASNPLGTSWVLLESDKAVLHASACDFGIFIVTTGLEVFHKASVTSPTWTKFTSDQPLISVSCGAVIEDPGYHPRWGRSDYKIWAAGANHRYYYSRWTPV